MWEHVADGPFREPIHGSELGARIHRDGDDDPRFARLLGLEASTLVRLEPGVLALRADPAVAVGEHRHAAARADRRLLVVHRRIIGAGERTARFNRSQLA